MEQTGVAGLQAAVRRLTDAELLADGEAPASGPTMAGGDDRGGALGPSCQDESTFRSDLRGAIWGVSSRLPRRDLCRRRAHASLVLARAMVWSRRLGLPNRDQGTPGTTKHTHHDPVDNLRDHARREDCTWPEGIDIWVVKGQPLEHGGYDKKCASDHGEWSKHGSHVHCSLSDASGAASRSIRPARV